MEENKINVTYSFPLWGIGILTGIILCILQGVGTIDIGWFWATFPFWIVPAVSIALTVLIVIIVMIVMGIQYLIER